MRNNNAGGLASSMIKWTSQKLSALIPSSTLPSSSSVPPTDAAFEDLRKLERTMKRIQAMVMTAEERGVRGQDEKLHLEELKEVAYDAEDVVDDYEFEVLSAEIKAGIHLGGNDHKPKHEDKVNHVTLSHLIVPVPSELAIRVKSVRERFDEIIREWEVLRWSEGESLRQYGVDMVKPPQSTSLVHEPSIHGRDKDKENIIELLISDDIKYNGDGSLSVLPLVGMGGIGKTTLAQLVYNDNRIHEYFQLRAWVCVSENFSVEILTRNIIASFTEKTCDFTELDDLQRTLVDEVKGKKFLIVLDDVWNEKPSLWHSLKSPLIGNSYGKVVVTTRIENVARNMQTMSSYVLTNLPFEYCWSIFKQLAFECHDINLNPDLLEIGKKIVGKCGGLPLAVQALGSLLRFEADDEESWQEILDSEIWELDMRNNDILPALKISYDRLPTHLKQCFIFLSVFPRDYVIFEDEIVRLWLSLGFVLPKGKKSLEDIGVGYVTELLQRSMIQLTAERCFIMHDLVNDLAQSLSGKHYSKIEPNMLHEIPSEARHISIVLNKLTDIIDLQYLCHLKAPRLVKVVNTICSGYRYFPIELKCTVIPPEFHMLKYVRALDFSDTDIGILSDSIGNLRQLRYLNIRNTNVRKLPDSICGLYNLQTLELQQSFIEELPNRISSLVNLRYFNLKNTKVRKLPDSICGLYNLQTLVLQQILIMELPDRINSLVNLCYFNITKTKVQKLPDLICDLYNLQTLELQYSFIRELPDKIDSLVNLRYLNIRCTKIRKLPDSICGLHNLQTLVLHQNLIKELPYRISSLINLKHLGLDSYMCIPRGIGQLLNLKTLPSFSVRPGAWHCKLSELRNLVNLKEKLCINGLKHVTSVKDAEEASLCNKRFLKELRLDWNGSCEQCHHSDQSCDNDKFSEQLLGALRPHAHIEKLAIRNYVGSSYPHWLVDDSFSKLAVFYLHGGRYSSSKSLPTLGQLPSLRDFFITDMPSIENVGHEFCSHDSKIIGFRSLKNLKFEGMPNWVNWSGVENGEFCSLRTLNFIKCRKLQLIPEPLCSSLSTLKVVGCRNLITPRLLPSLNCLIMVGDISEIFFDNLCLPLLKTLHLLAISSTSLVLISQNLPSIEVIEITGCEGLISVTGLSSLNSLNELELLMCPNLQLASDECLPHGLQQIDIHGCPQLDEWKQLQINKIQRINPSFVSI